MKCPACNGTVSTFDVPEDLREHLPKPVPHAGLCTRCLRLHPAETGGEPDFAGLEAFPGSPAASIPLAIAIGRLDSLALNRRSIETLFERAEAAGADPLLTLDRLATAGSVQPAIDLGRRRHQLEQLMDREPEPGANSEPEAEPETGAEPGTE
ncbi:MAG: DUF6276 family protein [Haloarculaceae archaeon]